MIGSNMEKKGAAIVTGASGFLGKFILQGIEKNVKRVYIFDKVKPEKDLINLSEDLDVIFHELDISNEKDVQNAFNEISKDNINVNILINGAAKNPTYEEKEMQLSSKFEELDVKQFNESVSDILLGTTLVCRGFIKLHDQSEQKTEDKIILNIGSDLSVIAPDNRIYGKDSNNEPIHKPIEYSIVKHGIVGLTKYLSIYCANKGIRVNCLSPTGVYNNQDKTFLENFSETVPMGRMLQPEEIIGHISFLTSNASSFLTGQNIIVDGGRSVW